jgi:orotidine-5'-phosphate decarboxylase
LQVLDLAQLAAGSGLDGVVASPLEASRIRTVVERSEFVIVTPGVRPEFGTKDDQKRVMTPRQAILEGSDYLVVGRPILQAKDRIAALTSICEEIDPAENV